MKNSRKIKKVLVSILTATLSIIMFVTQVGAANIVTISEEFTDERQVVHATEWLTWDKNRNWLLVGVDLSFNEDDNNNDVFASMELWITNTSTSPATEYFHDYIFDNLNYSDTLDSDELLFSFANFNANNERYLVRSQIIYIIYYDDGCTEEYTFENIYTLTTDGEIWHTRLNLNGDENQS